MAKPWISIHSSVVKKIVTVSVSCLLVFLLSIYLFGSYIANEDHSPRYFLKKLSRVTGASDNGENLSPDFQFLSAVTTNGERQYYSDKFLFHAGKQSVGGDLFQVEGLSIDQLKVLCYQSVGCVGFTTNGHLKRVIQPFNEWTTMEDMSQGLFTVDTDYCLLDEGNNCPVGAVCLTEVNGTYNCESIIHIGMSIDSKAVDGLIAVIQSIIEHTSNNQIIIHIITNTTDEVIIRDRVDCSINLPPNIMIDFKIFDLPKRVSSLIHIGPNVEHLKSNANYARFYLAQMLPNVLYLIYLDADIIVKEDIRKLWNEVVNTNKLLVITPNGNKKCGDINLEKVKKLYYERYKVKFEKRKCIQFNAGVFGINLRKWRENNVLEEIVYWMKEHKKNNLWGLVTQPLMYIVSYGNQKTISERWNLKLRRSCPCLIRKAYIIHWNGIDKPWYNRPKVSKENRVMRKYDKLWSKYSRDVCSDNGVCRRDGGDIKKTTAYCVCNDGYTGRLCNRKS